MRLLLRATATMGLAGAIGILLKMVGAKIVASALGTSGIGIYAQLVLIADFGTALSSLGFATGIIRYASEFRSAGSWMRLRSLESTLVTTMLPFSVLVGVSLAAFSGELSRVLLGESDYAAAVALVGLGLPLVSIAVIAEALTNGAKQVRLRAIVILAVAFAGLALLAPLVIFLGIIGAGIAIAATGAFRAMAAWLFAMRLQPEHPEVNQISLRQFDRSLLAKLLRYGSTSLVSTSTMYLAVIIVRGVIVTRLGASENGLYQVVWASQNSWQPLLFSAFNSYFYPSYCEARDLRSQRQQIDRIVRFMFLLSTPFLGTFMLFRSEVVLALYTPQFLPAAPLLSVSLLFGLFNVLAFCLTLPLLASGRLRDLMGLGLFQQSIFVALSYALISPFQILGVVYAAGVASLLAAVANLVYLRMQLGIRLSTQNLRTFLLSTGLVIAAFELSELPRALALSASFVLFLAWAHLVLEKSEVAAIWRLVYTRVGAVREPPLLPAAGFAPRRYPMPSPTDQASNPSETKGKARVNS